MDRLLKVMVLEDNERLRKALVGMLKTDPKIETSEAGTLAEAVILARAERTYCWLVDLSLPDAEGADVVDVIKHLMPSTTVVVLTGRGDETERLAKESGADLVIAKGSPESVGDKMIEAIRKTVAAHDVEMYSQKARDHGERAQEILSRITNTNRQSKQNVSDAVASREPALSRSGVIDGGKALGLMLAVLMVCCLYALAGRYAQVGFGAPPAAQASATESPAPRTAAEVAATSQAVLSHPSLDGVTWLRFQTPRALRELALGAVRSAAAYHDRTVSEAARVVLIEWGE